jgi:hypothetical protein
MLLEIELERIQIIDNPDDKDIVRAISNLKKKVSYNVTLIDDQESISTFCRKGRFEVTYIDHFGRVYANESDSLSIETVIRLFQVYSRNDSSWKKETAWKDITQEMRILTPITLFISYVLMIVGAVEILFGWLVRELLGEIVFAISILMGFAFISTGAAVWIVYKLKGRRKRKN